MKKIIKRISNRIYEERICLQCIKAFVPSDARQKFCTEQHRIDFHNDQRKIKEAPAKRVASRVLKNDRILAKIFEALHKINKDGHSFSKSLLEYEGYDFTIAYEDGINPVTKKPIEWFFEYGLEVADVNTQTFMVHKRDYKC